MLTDQENQSDPDTLLGTLSAVLLGVVGTSVILATRRRGCRTHPVPQPGAITILSKEQIAMTKFAYILSLPTPANISDVVRRKLTAAPAPGTEGDNPIVSVDITDPSAAESPKIVLDSGVTYYVTLTDFDAAGNASAPSDPLTLSVVDDVAPQQPGKVGVVSKTQVGDEGGDY